MHKLNADVPAGLFEILADLIADVLRDQPADFIEYAAAFFQKVWEEQGQNPCYKSAFEEESNSLMSSLLESIEEMDEGDLLLKPKADYRRKSVAAERINMDDFDDDEDMYTVIPKTDVQRDRLVKVCKQILLFKNLDDDQMGHVINAMFMVNTKPGEKVIVQGDDGDNFYVIEEGIFDCFIKDGDSERLIFTYKNEGYFGELALMYSAQRSATVVSQGEGILWGVDRKTFRTLVLIQTHVKKQVYDTFLKEFPIFQEMTSSERMNISDALVPMTYEDKEIIVRQGKSGQEMFFIESGEVLITRNHQGKEIELVRLHKGKYFGELALLSNQARQASAQAVGVTKCAMLDVKTFERLMGPCLEVMKRNVDIYTAQLEGLFGNEVN